MNPEQNRPLVMCFESLSVLFVVKVLTNAPRPQGHSYLQLIALLSYIRLLLLRVSAKFGLHAGNMKTNIESEGERMHVMMYILLPACFSIHHVEKVYC